MRQLKRRPLLTQKTRNKLAKAKASLLALPNPAHICEQRFDGARDTKWFIEVREALKNMATESQTCMFCDHNEPTDVEHFRPKVPFPRHTFSWGNMLWVCTTCNRKKGTKYPPYNCSGASILDPTIDNVWEYFFLDKYGTLIKKWDATVGGYQPRAQSTCDYVKIDRDEIQVRRRSRMKGLKKSVEQALGEYNRGEVTVPDLSNRVVDWLTEQYQADIADYFFRGPGRAENPFADLLALGVVVPPL